MIKRPVTYLLCLLLLSACIGGCANDISDQFLSTIEETGADSRFTIIAQMPNDSDRDAVLSKGNAMQIGIDGFYERRFLDLKLRKVGELYVGESLKVSPEKPYTITSAQIIDAKNNIIALVPIQGSVWAQAAANTTPRSVTSPAFGNKNIELTFFPSAGGNLETTGYSTLLENPIDVPYIEIDVQIEDDQTNTDISGDFTVFNNGNGATTIPTLYSELGRFSSVRIYYNTEDDIFRFKTGGNTSAGYKTFEETRTISYMKIAYDKATTGSSAYIIEL